MFYFNLFGSNATFDEKNYILSYSGEKQVFAAKQNNTSIKTAYLKFNETCNLKCSYCFQRYNNRSNQKRISLSEYDLLLDNIFSSGEFDRIILFGGEPFVSSNFDNIRKILEKCDSKRICAFTNGTFDDVFLDLLYTQVEKIEMITVTLDGAPEQHNRRRIFSNGTGTFDLILNRLTRMQERGIPFTIQINIDKDNINDLDALFKIINQNIPNVSSIILNRVLHESNEIGELELLHCFVGIKKEYTNLCVIPNSQCYKKLYSILTNNGILLKRCEIANTFVFDFQNSSVYSCPQSERTKCGSFSMDSFDIDQNKQKEYADYAENNNPICSQCDLRSLCMYGCAIEHDSQTMHCYNRNRACLQYVFDHFIEIFDLE